MSADKQTSRVGWLVLAGLVVGAGVLAVVLGTSSDPSPSIDNRAADAATAAPRVLADTSVATAEVAEAVAAEVAEAAGPRPLDCGQGERAAVRFGGGDALPPITVAELCVALEVSAGPGAGADAALRKRFGPGVLDHMIDDRLVMHALAAAALSVSDAAVEAETKRLVGERGIRETEAVRADVRAALGRAALVAATHPAGPTEVEIAAAYAATPGAWGTPASATVEGYLMRVAAGADAVADGRAKSEMSAFVVLLRKGRGLRAEAGIEALGRVEIEANGLEPALEGVVFGDAGKGAAKWSDPVRTKVGWLSVHVVETRPAVVRPLVEVEPLVRNAVVQRRDRAVEEGLVATLRARAAVSIDITW